MKRLAKGDIRGLGTLRLSRRSILGGSLVLGAGVVAANSHLSGVGAETAVKRIAAWDATAEEKQNAQYQCDGSNDHVEVKAALAALPLSGGTLMLSSGHFDFGGGNVTFNGRPDLVIQGAGMDVTFVSNNTNDAYDSEPLSFTRCDRTTVRDMTLSGGGNLRTTADTLDFDDSDDCLVERIKVVAARGRGIVFDGKDPGAQSLRNVIKDCVVTGCQGASGIMLLVTEQCQIINCVSTGNPGHGAWVHRSTTYGRRSMNNVISGGTFSGNGQSGIYIVEADNTTVDGVTCQNNGADGIRISTGSDSTFPANGNQVLNCICTDTRSTKIQAYGVNLYGRPASDIDGTLIKDCDLRGNRVGPYSDVAINTQVSGVTGVGPTPPTPTNTPTSTPTPSTTPVPTTGIFSDGFESGTLNAWGSSAGLVVQQGLVASGAFAARATSSGSAAYARKAIGGTYADLYFTIKFLLNSKDATTLYLGRLRTAGNASIVGVYISSSGRLGYRNDIAKASRTSAVVPSAGIWHTLEVHASVNGSAGLIEVWLDGERVDALCRAENFGSSGVGVIQIGDNASGRTFDVVFDDVVANTSCVGVCPGGGVVQPTATNTPEPTSTPVSTTEATSTPEPTRTPTPTSTPEPTNTPEPPTSTPTPEPYAFTFEVLGAEPPPGGTVDVLVTMTSGAGPVLVRTMSSVPSVAVASPAYATFSSAGSSVVVTLTDQTGPGDPGGYTRVKTTISGVKYGQSDRITFPAG